MTGQTSPTVDPSILNKILSYVLMVLVGGAGGSVITMNADNNSDNTSIEHVTNICTSIIERERIIFDKLYVAKDDFTSLTVNVQLMNGKVTELQNSMKLTQTTINNLESTNRRR